MSKRLDMFEDRSQIESAASKAHQAHIKGERWSHVYWEVVDIKEGFERPRGYSENGVGMEYLITLKRLDTGQYFQTMITEWLDAHFVFSYTTEVVPREVTVITYEDKRD